MIIVNVNLVLYYSLLIINILYSITHTNILFFSLHNILNLILLDLIIYYQFNKHIKIITLNLMIASIYCFHSKYLFIKILITSYFFTYYYNVEQNNRILEEIKYSIYIFLFEDNIHKYFFNDHLIIIHILCMCHKELGKIYSIYMITCSLEFNSVFIFTIFLYSCIFKKYSYTFYEIIFNDFCILLFYNLKNII